MSFLEINNLDIQYKTRKETIIASRNVTFNLERGEILGIVGESGSGKSTVANAIINLIDKPGRITNGSIKLDNEYLPELIIAWEFNDQVIRAGLRHTGPKRMDPVFDRPVCDF